MDFCWSMSFSSRASLGDLPILIHTQILEPPPSKATSHTENNNMLRFVFSKQVDSKHEDVTTGKLG